ncbi:MAG: M23 family metallopeptidase [Cytophagaceae bacterium]|nr:M23 family metallopeptidase [Gemmatimonadaceae bacterium]
MSILSVSKRAALLAVLLPTLGAVAGAQLADRPLFVEARVPKPPTIATGSTGSFLIYEVQVTSLDAKPLRWTRIDVMNGSADGVVLLSVADSALWRDLLRPAQGTIAFLDRATLGGAQRAVLFLRVPIPDGARVASLVHRLTMTDSTGARTMVMRPVPVMQEAIVIGPPLRGTNWFAANGPGNTSGHRRTHIPIEGEAGIAQRFAIDWVQMDTAFKTFQGDRLKNESYLAEDQDALAVLDGTVVATKDGIPENVPGANSRAVPITLETVGGNHVILDIGKGHYAFYAHLRPGSLRVKVGDRVKKGAVVGKVGNSGNSTEPHLHFHIADANSPLGSEGLPYVIESLELVGACRGFGQNCAFKAPEARRRVMPLDAEIIRFPK